jgi:hypothetical protein
MERRDFTLGLVKGAALVVVGGSAAWSGRSWAASLSVDDRSLTGVVDPLLMHARAKRAVSTDAGFHVRFEEGARQASLIGRQIEGSTHLVVRLGKVMWRYESEALGDAARLPLARYQSSISNVVHERSEALADDGAEVREWFLGHERIFQRMSARLHGRLRQGWECGSASLLHRMGRLRGELDPDEHVQIAPGESYRIVLEGGRPETRGARLDLRYDRAKDRFDLALRAVPRGDSVAHLSAHQERLRLVGDGSMLLTRYRLVLWRDDTIGVTYREGKGSDHPLYVRKALAAQKLVDLFPRYL